MKAPRSPSAEKTRQKPQAEGPPILATPPPHLQSGALRLRRTCRCLVYWACSPSVFLRLACLPSGFLRLACSPSVFLSLACSTSVVLRLACSPLIFCHGLSSLGVLASGVLAHAFRFSPSPGVLVEFCLTGCLELMIGFAFFLVFSSTSLSPCLLPSRDLGQVGGGKPVRASGLCLPLLYGVLEGGGVGGGVI